MIISSIGGFRAGEVALFGKFSVMIVSLSPNGEAEVKLPDGSIESTRVDYLCKRRNDLPSSMIETGR